MYQKMVRTHSDKDQKVEWQRLEEAQRASKRPIERLQKSSDGLGGFLRDPED